MNTSYSIPWIEKYRPNTLSEIVGNSEIIESLKQFVLKETIPHLLLTVIIIIKGPPGIGKTSSILAITKELLGEKYRSACIELNASDERGIDVIRKTIKDFASQKSNIENREKIIILDEADSLTEQAQQALRVIMEEHVGTTRFALACNDSTKIIEPIQSRTTIIRFTKLNEYDIKKRLEYVINKENIAIDEIALDILVNYSEGDMRIALNNLQSASIVLNNRIFGDDIYIVIFIK